MKGPWCPPHASACMHMPAYKQDTAPGKFHGLMVLIIIWSLFIEHLELGMLSAFHLIVTVVRRVSCEEMKKLQLSNLSDSHDLYSYLASFQRKA